MADEIPNNAAAGPDLNPPEEEEEEEDNEQQQEEQQQQEVRLIHDLEHYIRTNGIAPVDEQHSADVYYADENHTARRQNAESDYQDSVHRSAFAAHDEREEDVRAEKQRVIASLQGRTIVVVTAGKSFPAVPLDILASTCDTVYTLVRSRPLFSRQGSAISASSSPEEGKMDDDDLPSTLDLQTFGSGPVESFLSMAVYGQPITSIPGDHIVEVCRVSHYVQCSSVLNQTTDILKENIDSDNCLSICQLADQLGVPSLFEASVSHLIGTLDNMQDHEHWDDFPTSLQHRVITMRNAVHSSILGRGQKTSVFFSSSEEFLAIFSDNIREQRERLVEAKRRQEEVISERIHRGGRHRDPFGGSVQDAAEKIERQEKRLQTLETFYKEQKMIFAGGGGGGNEGQKPFRLGYS